MLQRSWFFFYLKISVDILWHDVLRFRLVLTVHDVHVQPSLLELGAKVKSFFLMQKLAFNNMCSCKTKVLFKIKIKTCLTNKGASRSGSSKHFSSSPRKKLWMCKEQNYWFFIQQDGWQHDIDSSFVFSFMPLRKPSCRSKNAALK